MPITVTTQPTDLLRRIVAAYPSINAAARAFNISNASLDKFLTGKGNLSADSLASIMDATKLSYNALFTHKEEEE